MSQSTLPQAQTVRMTLPGLPQGPLTPAQQAEALARVQSQAEQRVQLGVQLFNAAEARTSQHRQVLDQIKAEQATFRREVEQDMSRSFQAYDAWIGQTDAQLTASIKSLEEKMERLQQQWASTQTRIEGMVQRSEKLLAQTRDLLDEGKFVPTAMLAKTQAAAAPPTVVTTASTSIAEAVRPTISGGDPPSTDPAGPVAPPLPPNFYTDLVQRLDEETAA